MVSSSKFFRKKNELEDIDTLIKQLEPFTHSNTKELPFWTRDNGEKDQEKAIYRLVKTGLVKDYEKNWGVGISLFSRMHLIWTIVNKL